MKKKKYLPLYYKFIDTGMMSNYGLCDSIGTELGAVEKDKFISLFQPSPGWKGLWGYDGINHIGWLIPDVKYEEIAYSFSPLRQNLILLMAATNGEL